MGQQTIATVHIHTNSVYRHYDEYCTTGPTVDEEGDEYKHAETKVKGQSALRLSSFLKRAGQVGRLISNGACDLSIALTEMNAGECTCKTPIR